MIGTRKPLARRSAGHCLGRQGAQHRQVRCAVSSPVAAGRRLAASSAGQAGFGKQLERRAPTSQQHQQQLQQQQASVASADEARHLTSSIKACGHWHALQLLCERSGRRFNHINLSAAITHLAQLQQQASEQPGSDLGPSTSYAPTPTPIPGRGLFLPRSQTSTSSASGPRTMPQGAARLMERLLLAAGYNLSVFGTRQLANILWAVAKVGHRPKAAWLQAVVQAAGGLWGQYEAQHLSNMAYALALLGHDPGKPWLERMLQESMHLLGSFKPQELSSFLHACATLLPRARMPARRVWLSAVVTQSLHMMDAQAFSGQELACVAWALSRLAHDSGHQQLLLSPSDHLASPAAHAPVSTSAHMAPPASHLATHSAHSASTLAGVQLDPAPWPGAVPAAAAAAGGASTTAAMGGQWETEGCEAELHSTSGAAAAAASEGRLGSINGSGNSSGSSMSGSSGGVTTLPAAASAVPLSAPASNGSMHSGSSSPWMHRVLSAALLRLHAGDLSAQGVACVLLSAARLRYRPGDAVLRQVCLYAQALLLSPSVQQQRQWYQQWEGQGPGIWGGPSGNATAASRMPSSSGSSSSVANNGNGNSSNSSMHVEPQAVANLLLALGRLRFRPPNSCMAAYEASAASSMRTALQWRRHRSPPASLQSSQSLLPEHLGAVLWGMARLGWTPSADFLQLHLLCTASLAPAFSGGQVAQVLWALAQMRVRVGRQWLDTVCGQMHASLASLTPREAVMALSALAWQRYSPSSSWLHALCRCLLPQLSGTPGRGLALLLTRLATLGHRPGPAWLSAWADAMQGRVHELDASHAAGVLWSGALVEVVLPPALHEALALRYAEGAETAGRRAAERAAWALACHQACESGEAPEYVQQALLAARAAGTAGETEAGEAGCAGAIPGVGTAPTATSSASAVQQVAGDCRKGLEEEEDEEELEELEELLFVTTEHGLQLVGRGSSSSSGRACQTHSRDPGDREDVVYVAEDASMGLLRDVTRWASACLL